MDKAKRIYRLIKIGGLVSFIPVVLFTGPIGGYLLGELAVRKLGWNNWVMVLFVLLGFSMSVREIVKIIRMIVRTDQELSDKQKV